jgi:hypothetical protein
MSWNPTYPGYSLEYLPDEVVRPHSTFGGVPFCNGTRDCSVVRDQYGGRVLLHDPDKRSCQFPVENRDIVAILSFLGPPCQPLPIVAKPGASLETGVCVKDGCGYFGRGESEKSSDFFVCCAFGPRSGCLGWLGPRLPPCTPPLTLGMPLVGILRLTK